MKTTFRNLLAAILVAASLQTHAQGLVYDQQTTNPPSVLGDYFNLQADSPLMQSFVPALSAIGFAQFQFWDMANNGTSGATVYVNLWTGSPNTSLATLLGSTTPVYMPDGFGASSAGVTTFYFSTIIALTAGETYYLQPVVLSGDNPWAIKVNNDFPFEDYYPNGDLFANNGVDTGIDLWFREGVIVPEPSTLALVALVGILAFGFKRRSKLVVLILLASSVLPIHAADSVVQATADEVGLAPASATTLPDNGTFWVMSISPDGDLIESPYPVLPDSLSTLPIYSVTNDIYMVDDTGGELAPSSAGRMSSAQATSIAQNQAATTASLIEQIQFPTDESFQPDGFTPMIYTNGLWLESWRTNQNNLWLRLHGTIGNDNYQLLSTTNLSGTNWDLGQILLYASDGQADFSPVPITNKMTFFRAHHANPVMYVMNEVNS